MTLFHPKTNNDIVLEWLKVLLLVAVTALAYTKSIDAGFFFDDYDVVYQTHLKWTSLDFDNLANIWQKSLHKFRPVANASFGLNYFFHQYNPVGYHLVNIVIHVVTGIFLFILVQTTISLPALRAKCYSSRWVPFLTALIWLVHPVQTQSVTYVVQRMNSMAAMFYLIAIFAYVRGRLATDWPWKVACFGGAAGAGLLALGSKEIALTLPFFVVLYDWYFLQDLERGWLKKYGLLIGGIICLLVVAIFLFYFGKDPLGSLLAGYAGRDFTLGERLLTESRVVIFYLSLLILPLPGRLNLEHDFVVSQSLFTPLNTIFSLAALLLLLGMAVSLARHHRLLSFCLIWFLGNLVIESSVVPLEIIFEHRLYLPSMMLILALVSSVGGYFAGSRLARVLVVGLILVLSFWTYQRNQVWADPVLLWRDCLQKSPAKARVHNNMGMILHKKGLLPEESEAHLRQAVQLDGSFAVAYCNLGNIMFEQGRFDEAIDSYVKALEIYPDIALWHFNLGDTLAKVWRLQEAQEHFKIALDLDPGNIEARRGLARVSRMVARNKNK